MKLQSLKMGLLSSALLIFLYSCKTEVVQPAESTPDKEEVIQDTTQNDDKSNLGEKDADYKEIGTGSGPLIIKDIKDENYSIKEGRYTSLHLENLENVKIKGLNKVKFTHSDNYISRVNGLYLSGITIEDLQSPAFNIYDSANNLTFEDMIFKNISNTVIRFQIDKKYDGTPESYSENIHFINIKAENIGTLIGTHGQIHADGFSGLIKGFKLTNSTIKNSPHLRNGVYLGCAEDYEISNNIVDNVNKSDQYPHGNNDHNGIFHVNGNGKIFNNKITNHQGNGIRAWLYSIVKPDAMVEIYNNIVHNSTRYSAFELQVTPWMETLPSFKPIDAKVYNNTTGQLNTGQPKFYEGRIVDIYQTFGSVEVYNNLYFNMIDDEVSLNQSNPKDTKVKETNNKYFKNASDAVVDLKNFVSKVPGIGAKL